MIEKKHINVTYGKMAYYRNKHDTHVILYIHGLGGLVQTWFPDQYSAYGLNKYPWIIPILLGYPESDHPQKEKAYLMSQYATDILQILLHEQISSVFICAHSMGGPIAISLIEQIIFMYSKSISIENLLYIEGNLDINDCFWSSKIVKHSYEGFLTSFNLKTPNIWKNVDSQLIRALNNKKVSLFALWASSKDLVKESRSNTLLSRLRKHLSFPVLFLFGEKSIGRYTSEELIKTHHFQIEYISGVGHDPLQEDPVNWWTFFSSYYKQ